MSKVKWREVATLRGDPRNPRIQIAGEDRAALVRSITRFGFVAPILVAGDVIVDGHQRLDVWTTEFKQTKVPVFEIDDLDDDERLALNMATDRIRTSFDHEKLVRVLQQIAADSMADLQATGFTQQELVDLRIGIDAATTIEQTERHDSSDSAKVSMLTKGVVHLYFVLTKEQRDTIMKRLRETQKKHGLEQTADALCYFLKVRGQR